MVKKKKLTMYGFFWLWLKLLSIIYNKVISNSFSNDLSKKEKLYYGSYKESVSASVSRLMYFVDSINSNESITLLSVLKPDFICFLGGDIAQKESLECAKIATLNYHSGLSPIYNGTKTIFQAVSDARPNLAGGTLMYMNERIDGGKIISHFLPEISKEDTAADLFLKNIDGAVQLYLSFFEQVTTGNLPEGVSQKRSVKFLRNIDWTLENDIKLNWVRKSGVFSRYTRRSLVLNHFDLKEDDMDEVVKRLTRGTLYN